jgi:hypothetical protein
MVKKGILLAFIAQLAIVGFALDAKAKQCTSCEKKTDGTYTCTGCA